MGYNGEEQTQEDAVSLPQINPLNPLGAPAAADPLGMLSPTSNAALNRLGASLFSNDMMTRWMASEMAFNQRLMLLLMGLMQGANSGALGAGGGAMTGSDGTGGGGGMSSASGGGSSSVDGGQSQPAGPISPEDKKWLSGDTEGLDPRLAGALAQVGKKLGKKIDIRSGHRSRQEQEVLYQKYLNGTGNLAAKPGQSNHESGRAADVYVEGVALRDHPQGRAAAAEAGIVFPVASESWHAELKTLRA